MSVDVTVDSENVTIIAMNKDSRFSWWWCSIVIS